MAIIQSSQAEVCSMTERKRNSVRLIRNADDVGYVTISYSVLNNLNRPLYNDFTNNVTVRLLLMELTETFSKMSKTLDLYSPLSNPSLLLMTIPVADVLSVARGTEH